MRGNFFWKCTIHGKIIIYLFGAVSELVILISRKKIMTSYQIESLCLCSFFFFFFFSARSSYLMYSIFVNVYIMQVVMNTDRLLKHAVQEKLAITVCINKVCFHSKLFEYCNGIVHV